METEFDALSLAPSTPRLASRIRSSRADVRFCGSDLQRGLRPAREVLLRLQGSAVLALYMHELAPADLDALALVLPTMQGVFSVSLLATPMERGAVARLVRAAAGSRLRELCFVGCGLDTGAVGALRAAKGSTFRQAGPSEFSCTWVRSSARVLCARFVGEGGGERWTRDVTLADVPGVLANALTLAVLCVCDEEVGSLCDALERVDTLGELSVHDSVLCDASLDRLMAFGSASATLAVLRFEACCCSVERIESAASDAVEAVRGAGTLELRYLGRFSVVLG